MINMDLRNVHFSEKDVQDFMNELDIDAILKNIDEMPNDNDIKF